MSYFFFFCPVLTILFFYSEAILKPDQIRPGLALKPLTISQKTRIQCLSCSVEFLYSKFDEYDLCYNPVQNFSLAKEYLMTLCSYNAVHCITEVIRIHGVIAGVNRKCGFSFCSEFCIQRGFGVEQETCSFCCEGIQNNHASYECPKFWAYLNLKF